MAEGKSAIKKEKRKKTISAIVSKNQEKLLKGILNELVPIPTEIF